MLGFGKKFCYTCGKELRGGPYKRFGKSFCSEEHAEQYAQELYKARQAQIHRQERDDLEEGCC